jgi:hypothetical protein
MACQLICMLCQGLEALFEFLSITPCDNCSYTFVPKGEGIIVNRFMCVDRKMGDMCRHNIICACIIKKINQSHIYSQTLQYPVGQVAQSV